MFMAILAKFGMKTSNKTAKESFFFNFFGEKELISIWGSWIRIREMKVYKLKSLNFGHSLKFD